MGLARLDSNYYWRYNRTSITNRFDTFVYLNKGI